MRKCLVVLWLLGMLLPVAWLAQLWAPSRQVFAWLFGPLWMHVLMHALLFAVLGYLLARGLARSPALPGWRAALAAVGLVLAVALLQEAIQLLYKARPLGRDELLDLAVDVAGAALGALVARARQATTPRRG